MAIRNYGKIDSVEELAEHIDRITVGTVFSYDIETGYHGPDREKGSIHAETAFIVGISFTTSTHWARYVPLGHDEGENLDNYQCARLFWPLLNTGLGVAHNHAFELRHLAKWFRRWLWDDPDYGEQVRASRGYYPIRSDTQVEAYLKADSRYFGLKYLTQLMFDRQGNVIDPSGYRPRADEVARIKSLKDPEERKAALAAFDGHVMTELAELFPHLPKNQHKFLRFNVLPQDPHVIEYACEDSVWCLAIHQYLFPQVKSRPLFTAEKHIVQDVLGVMEDEGLCYDWARMHRVANELRSFRDKFNAEIMAQLTALAGEPIAFDLASPHRLGKVLFEKLGMRTNVYTKTTKDLPPDQRRMSTGKIALERLAKQYPVVQRIREWKKIQKLLGTYLDKYEERFNYAEDGRSHPSLLSAFVVTGRFAHSDPNYAQSPKKYHYDLNVARGVHEAHQDAHGKPDGKSWCECSDPEFIPPPGSCFQFNFRDVIVAPPDYYILGFDLSQAELRAIAGEAQEHALLAAFERGDDVHRLTASLMLGVPLDEITEKQRDIGKTMNFALLYGMSTRGLADRLAISRDEAQVLMDKYFAGLPAIAAYMVRQKEFGKANNHVKSRFGRVLPIWQFQSDKEFIKAEGERACVNYPIQGAATGDYMKIAMVRAVDALKKAGLADKVKLVMNVHDALEFYVHVSLQPPQVIKVLRPAVVFPVSGWPQMKADWHYALKWGSPIELAVDDDGNVTIKNQKDRELIAPEFEEDEDGELVEVLPEVDTEVLRAVASR